MPRTSLVSVDRPEVAPLAISARLRNQLVYFMTAADTPGIPPLAEGEYYFDPKEVDTWVLDGVFLLVSPLDTDQMTEVELSEEQETMLAWLQSNRTSHVRLVEA